MENEVLLTNRELRDANMDKVYVLEKVKKLMTISSTDFVTTQMVANYYEVTDEAIRKITKANMDEFLSDGMRKIHPSDFLTQQKLVQNISKKRGAVTFDFNDGSSITIPNLGMRIYPKRAVLRIGMLLQQSEIAKAVRTALLDKTEDNSLETVNTDVQMLVDTVNELKSLLADSLKVISADRVVFSDIMNKQHKLIVDLVEKSAQPVLKTELTKEQKDLMHEYATTTPSEKNLDGVSWKQNINELLKVVCDETKREKNMVLSDAYKMMKSLYGIDINLYQREYHATIKTPRVPSMFDTICWMETNRETSLNGTMERILWSMLDDVQVVA